MLVQQLSWNGLHRDIPGTPFTFPSPLLDILLGSGLCFPQEGLGGRAHPTRITHSPLLQIHCRAWGCAHCAVLSLLWKRLPGGGVHACVPSSSALVAGAP